MSLYESIPLIGDFFSITYIRNRGVAFSLLEDNRFVLLILPLVIIIVGMYFLIKYGVKKDNFNHEKYSMAKVLFTGLSFIIGGGIGNLIDRLYYGYVVDYLHLNFWPVFNLADIFVVAGCGLLVIWIWKQKEFLN